MIENGPVTTVEPRAGAAHAEAARLPELLAPAGDWECAKAAVENGADAIYFGLAKFNARMRAHNFTAADLPALMEFLHRRGVKGYVTFNTLVFADELAEAERLLRAIIVAGVDAAIVQDVGICRLLRRLSPDFPIHASTQMSITSAAGVEFARELGCNLVVLARELSIQEIERISREASVENRALTGEGREARNNRRGAAGAGSGQASALDSRVSTSPQPATLAARPSTLPLEVFVHGALCVAYSGQCLTSEALGGRSANRGECAQACRMPYELICDGKSVPLGDRRYLLSPQDLAGLEALPDLLRAGVASLKIEGRLKSPEYVANITRIYRQALDALVESRKLRVASPTPAALTASRPLPPGFRPFQYELEMAFSRGLHTGWLRGINHQRLVHAHFGKKRGVFLGEVTRVLGEMVFVKLEGPLKPGDGVVFDAGQPEEKEEGGRVYEVKVGRASSLPPKARAASDLESPAIPPHVSVSSEEAGRMPALPCEVTLTFGRGDIDFGRLHVGDKVWKTSDPELERRLRQSFAGDQPHFRRPIDVEVHGAAGRALTVLARDESGHIARVESAVPLAPAEKQPLTAERLREQLGRLGGTPFQLGALRSYLEDELILPVSELNRMRRQFVAELEAQRGRPRRWTLRECGLRSADGRVEARQPNGTGQNGQTELIVLVRNLAQLETAMACGVRTIYCEFEDPKRYREAVARFRERQGRESAAVGELREARSLPVADRPSPIANHRGQIFVAPPRIFKPGEEWILKQVRSCEADGYLARNYDHLDFFADCRRVGDFSLNVANPLTAEYLMERYDLERVTASYDLNLAQLEALLRAAPPEWFEITIHQHMPMFHMEHCVFCAFLTSGTDYTNCGRPCDKHQLKLRDRVGAEHPVRADLGCRNTVFNALAQTGAEGVARLLALGARRFRLEFLNEPPEQLALTIEKYRQLLRGEITGAQLWRELKLLNQLGVTRGPMA
jgi:putative protease